MRWLILIGMSFFGIYRKTRFLVFFSVLEEVDEGCLSIKVLYCTYFLLITDFFDFYLMDFC